MRLLSSLAEDVVRGDVAQRHSQNKNYRRKKRGKAFCHRRMGQDRVAPGTADESFAGAGRFLQLDKVTHEIAKRLTLVFAVESCDDGVAPDAARELPRQ
jgi:hypothetical protein